MLVLSRKIGESLVISGKIVVTVVRVDGDSVRLGIAAPADVPVHRQEVYNEIQRNNREALTRQRQRVPKLPFRNHLKTEVETSPATTPG
jgi:carbon storage regulator